MASKVDIRHSFYAVSDVIANRPKPLRIFDQIHMKAPDMLLQAEHLGRWFSERSVLFIGDGDAIGLTLVHLAKKGLIGDASPKHVTVLDFDERVVYSVNRFAESNGLTDLVHAELYNVAECLPKKHWQSHDAFYTNPPWGKRNAGESVLAFIKRGVEGVKSESVGCIVIGDHLEEEWTHNIQIRTQSSLLNEGFRVAEMIPEFHKYHLDDSPDLTSCSLIVKRHDRQYVREYNSAPIEKHALDNFYGTDKPLRVRYIRDLTNGDTTKSNDIQEVLIEDA